VETARTFVGDFAARRSTLQTLEESPIFGRLAARGLTGLRPIHDQFVAGGGQFRMAVGLIVDSTTGMGEVE
jgi:hypothetical protein